MGKELAVLIENGNPQLLSSVTIALLNNGFNINNYCKKQADTINRLWILFSTSSTAINVEKIKLGLGTIAGVLDVQISGTDKDCTPTKPVVSNELTQLAESIVNTYPDIIRPVLQFEASVPSARRDSLLYELGQQTGQHLFAKRFKNMRINGPMINALSQFVVPALQPFTLVELKQTELKLSLSPFAINRHSESPQCHFIAGFVAGLLNSPADAVPVHVSESACQAQGNRQCTFELSRK